MIALVCIRSGFAAVQTLLPFGSRIAACPALARIQEVAEASTARLAPATSGGGMIEPWPLSPLPPRACVVAGPARQLRVEGHLEAEPGRGGPVRCGVQQESLHGWNPKYAPIPAEMQTSQTTKPVAAEFVGANRWFARLVLHQVRPHDPSAVGAQTRIGFSHNRRPNAMSVTAPSVESPSTPIETLFRELARRRLRRLAAMESLSS